MSSSLPAENQIAHEHDPDAWITPGRFALLLAALIIAGCPKVVLGLQTFVFRDFGVFGYPLAYYHQESFWRGELPLWNPLSDCGLPFLAQWNTMALYPGSLFYLLFPLSWSLGVFCLLHQFLGGLGMYYLAHRWSGNRLAAAVAGVVFSFNGLMLNSLMWPNNIAAFGLMPWVVLCAQAGWQNGRSKLILAAVVGAAQILTGAPEIILFTWLILLALAINDLFEKDCKRLQLTWRFGLIVLLAAGLSAAQLLPFLELLLHSHRAGQFSESGWAMPGWGWANLVVPLFHCAPTRQGVFFQSGQYWTSSYYPGIGALALGGLSAIIIRARRVRLLSIIALASLVVALGENGHLYGLLNTVVPPAKLIRYPVKYVILVVFVIPLLAAAAIAEVRLATPTNRVRFFRGALICWGIIALLIGVIIRESYLFPFPDEQFLRTLPNGLGRIIFLSLILGALFCLTSFDGKKIKVALALGLILLFRLDFAAHAPPQNPTVTRNVYTLDLPRPQLAPKPVHGSSRVMVSPEANSRLRNVFVPDLFNHYFGYRLALFANCNLLDDIPKIDSFFSLYLREQIQVRSCLYALTNLDLSNLMDFMGVSHVTAPDTYFEWLPRVGCLPMVTAGQRPVFLNSADTLQAIISPEFDPREIVYLPQDAQAFVTATNQIQARITSINVASSRVEVGIESSQPTMLVLAQTYYNPWRAFVDGKPARLWRANYAFQALQAPQGKHRVEVVYRDSNFLIGAIISGASLLVCIAYWRITRRRNKRIQ